MTNRPVELSSKDFYSQAESRLNQQIRSKPNNNLEGCPVIDERGTVCGETDSLCVFQEFRKIYEECLKKLGENSDGSILMKRLTPFRKIVEDLWQQNAMLVEAVEELEQEATSQVTNLQIKLDKSCQKVFEYEKDIRSLIEVIRRLNDDGEFDTSGLMFYTLCPACILGTCGTSCPFPQKEEKKRIKPLRTIKNDSVYKIENWTQLNCSKGSDTTHQCDCEAYNDMNEDYQDIMICPNMKSSSFSSEVVSDENKFGFEDDCLESIKNITAVQNSFKVMQINNCFCEENGCQDHIKLLNINMTLPKESILSTSSFQCECSCTEEPCSDLD